VTSVGCSWSIAIWTLGLRGPRLEEALRAWVTGRRALVRREADFAPLLFNKEIANDTRMNEQ
jgi:hypothetical protein